MALLVETLQQEVQHGHLARRTHEFVQGRVVGIVFGSGKQKGMRTTFAQLHNQIAKHSGLARHHSGIGQQTNVLE